MPAESDRPRGKVLFIVMDQMRGDCVAGALAGTAQLPNLRRLMAEGVTFARHYSVTTPCGPSRASLLTGLYAMNHGSVRNGAPLAGHHTNLALELRKGGYEPLLFGYTDTSPDPTHRHPEDPDLKGYEGLLPGFTEVVQMRFETNYAWLADLKTKGYDLPDYKDLFAAVDPEGRGRLNAPTLYRAEDSDTAFLTNETLKALSVREDEHWFAHVAYLRPHPPLAAPAPYCTMYPPETLPAARLPESLEAERRVHPAIAACFGEAEAESLYVGFDGRLDRMPADDRQTLRAVYLGLASEVDHHIGRLLDYLKESGQDEDTLIVVTSDHGEMLGDHFLWGKETVYDPAFHVPLIIRDPRNPAAGGRVVEAFTESVDVAPTIMEWLHLTPPLAFNGRALTPFLEGRSPEAWRDYVYCELELGDPLHPSAYQRTRGLNSLQSNAAVLREQRFKYVHFNGGLPPLLFDLENDPHEMADLAGDPAYAVETLRLARRMLDHRMTFAHHALSLIQITARGAEAAAPPASSR